MVPDHPYRRLSDHLTLAADALLLTVVAAAALLVLKDLFPIPTAWMSAMDAFLVNMTLASLFGATASWFFHRRSTGARGYLMLVAGLIVAMPALLIAHEIIIRTQEASPGTEVALLVWVQILGLSFLIPPLLAGAADLFQLQKRKFEPFAIVRLTSLLALVALVTFRFLPETQADHAAAHMNAMLGLSTIAGALGVGVADAILLFTRNRADRRRDAEPAPAETV